MRGFIGFLLGFLLCFVISILYNIGISDSKEECKTNHPELIETQTECLSTYPSIGSSTGSSTGSGSDTDNLCVGNFKSLCAGADNCSETYTSLGAGIGVQCVPSPDGSACNAYNDDQTNMNICTAPLRDCNGNSVSSCLSIGNDSSLCSQSYSPSGTPGYAIQCIPSSNGDTCNHWNDGSSYQNAEICRIPQ